MATCHYCGETLPQHKPDCATPGEGVRWCDTCNGGPGDHEPDCPNTFERQAERAREEERTRLAAAVTAEDRRAAWDAFFARPAGLEHVPVIPPEQMHDSQITLEALARVIAADRLRVIARASSN